MRRIGVVAFCVIALVIACLAGRDGFAAEFPTRRIQIVVPYPPGGPADVTARIIAQEMSTAMGQPVIIVNRPGAASIPAAEFVLHAPKDGYTLLLMTNVMPIYPLLYKTLPYQVSDFTPVSLIARLPFALIAPKNLPTPTLKDYIAYGKAHPKALNYGTTGAGSQVQLLAKLFEQKTGVAMQEIAYTGAAAAEQDVIAGRTQFFFDSPLIAVSQYHADRLRILGMTSADRLPIAPDIPTLKEQGLDIVEDTWFAIVAPRGTPSDVIGTLHDAVANAVASPTYGKRVASSGGLPQASTPQELTAMIGEETTQAARLIRSLNLQLQ